MELSAKTEAFLANFAKINQNMLFLEGNTIKTMSEARNVLASANIEESIPKEFGIYDLNEFLRVIALVNPKPSLKFEDDNILFRDSSGRMKVKYFYSSKESIFWLILEKLLRNASVFALSSIIYILKFNLLISLYHSLLAM